KTGDFTPADVSIGLTSLAQLYSDQGRYGEAQALYERALASREQVLGRYHPSVSVILIPLADLYRTRGRYAEAEALYRRVLAIPDQPSSGGALNGLALTLCAQGRLVEAEPLFKRFRASQASLEVAVCLNHLADLHSTHGHYAEAKSLYARALTVLDNILDRLLPSQASSAAPAGELFHAAQRALAAETAASFAEMATRGHQADLQVVSIDPGLQYPTGEWQKRADAEAASADRIAEIDKTGERDQRQDSDLPQLAASSH